MALLRRRLTEAALPHLPNASHIVPVMVGDAVLCKAISDELLERYAIYVQPINFPTVPRGAGERTFASALRWADSETPTNLNRLWVSSAS